MRVIIRVTLPDRHRVQAVGLALLGLSLSLLLIPGKHEIALMQLRDRHFDEARSAYEAELAGGDLSPVIVAPLTQLYLQYGNVERAISLIEEFVDQNPEDLDALKRAGTLYHYGQRQDDYIRNLENVGRKAPSEDTLRELSRAYNFKHQYDKQISALQALLQIDDSQTSDFVDLAYLQASQKQIQDALATLGRLSTRHPEAIHSEVQELYVHLLVDAGQPQEAYNKASSWLETNSDQDLGFKFVDTLQFKGQPELALRLLEHFEGQLENHDDLMSIWVHLQIRTGHPDIAFHRLKSIYLRSGMKGALQGGGGLIETLMHLALDARESTLATNAAIEAGLANLHPELLVRLAETAYEEKRLDFVKLLLADLGSGFLSSQPVLAAEITFHLGDAPAARKWITTAERDPQLDAQQRVMLAFLYRKMRRPDDSLRLLQELGDRVPDHACPDLAQLYLELNRVEEGLALFEKLRHSRGSAEIDESWVQLAVAGGRPGVVSRWIENSGRELSQHLLERLYFLSMDREKPALAVQCARLIYDENRNNKSRLWLGSALAAAGNPGEGLDYLRPVRKGSPIEISAYEEALQAHLRAGGPVELEAQEYWGDKLQRPGLTLDEQEEIVWALIEVKGEEVALGVLPDLARTKPDPWLFTYLEVADRNQQRSGSITFLKEELERDDLPVQEKETRLAALVDRSSAAEVLPYVRHFAHAVGGDWVPVYSKTLVDLERVEEYLDFMRHRGSHSELPREERRAAAFELLNMGAKTDAERTFLGLAEGAGPSSEEVSELLFLWGPRPPEGALDWLEGRAATASFSDRVVWIRHLLVLGAPERAAKVLRNDLPAPGVSSPLIDVYIDTMVQIKDRAALSSILARELKHENRIRRSHWMAERALALELDEIAFGALQAVVEAEPDNQAALRQLAGLFFKRGDRTSAKKMFAHYLWFGDGDPTSHMIYAELLKDSKDQEGARHHYQRALEMAEQIENKSFEINILRAHLLHRNGRSPESVEEFEKLMHERPGHEQLRAEFVSVLLDLGRYEQARGLLSAPGREQN